MSPLRTHPESHLVDRIGWLRAAVLGANDGIVSTASSIVSPMRASFAKVCARRTIVAAGTPEISSAYCGVMS